MADLKAHIGSVGLALVGGGMLGRILASAPYPQGGLRAIETPVLCIGAVSAALLLAGVILSILGLVKDRDANSGVAGVVLGGVFLLTIIAHLVMPDAFTW